MRPIPGAVQVIGTDDPHIEGELLRTLTALVVSNMDYDEMKIEYSQREHQRQVDQQIEAAIAARNERPSGAS